ncbi:toprim domain-containing protein [Actinomadura parmotrematis]|uniref:Toprim domain-containing protein n=1 Tax=Actinomadura parmotrematis TaxID=2864039 RepID=A0ABS7FPG3_9ACTN|nr:toprim domain-containing protein [Actinomadura parmotrematis]MBW8481659.1 toprim domain-containing protein [Actinomadura parmotrematis]
MTSEGSAMPEDTSVLRDLAGHQAARLHDGTLPWAWWLEHAARHGRYGFTNTLLIAAQWRAATDVRSYAEWQAAGRQVRRGEAGIRVLARGGGTRPVFDVAQTAGLPLPRPEPGEARIWERLAAEAARCGLPVRADDGPDALAHRLALDLAPRGLPRADLVARSVAFVVLARLGLEPPPPAFPSPADWADDRLGDTVLRLARILHARLTDPSGDLMSAAHRFFRARVRDGWVPGYLAERGFARGVQRRWQIGYAPAGRRDLLDHLLGLGHTEQAVVAAGLARPGGRDTFRDRAMFAIRAEGGAVAGFIGRRRDGGTGPKYLNGPNTSLFRKGELLYGLHEASGRLAEGARPVLVEGPLDAIAVDLAAARGHAAVATCGVAVTPAQVAALARACDLERAGLLVALDGDAAGRSAAVRAWPALAAVPGPVDTAVLPGGRDPAQLLHEGGRAAVRAALRSPGRLLDLVVDDAASRAGGPLQTNEARLSALRAAVAVIAAARPAEAARQVVRLAARLDVPPALVTAELLTAAAP